MGSTSSFQSYQSGLLGAEAFGRSKSGTSRPAEGSTLQDKALVSTTLPDGMYYEVTYDKAKRETYIDAYKKFDNVCITDDEEVS